MPPQRIYFLILLWILILHLIGILFFAKGFLLKRTVIEQNSSCHVNFSVKAEDEGDGCWMHKRFNRSVILIIDALRYDFATYDKSINADSARSYQNKLKIFHELINTHPQNARLYKFLADPPTTTMQRLKGLTTGSLPTFVDAGSNFASSEITEDNIIDQLRRLEKKIVFMGDDTWMGLYPGRFERAYEFPSFNVKDIHTVDDGVLKHLVPELRKPDWDVIVGHFLGVDHCGHTYGMDHSVMAEKLQQMDQMIRDVIKELNDDTVLFVFGDHGMTRTGDHGGDSQDELESALFVYSNTKITAPPPKKIRPVHQVDLVPTLALLLGTPIPYSNLGQLISDLFTWCSSWKTDGTTTQQVYHAVKALRLNAHQVQEYLQSYTDVSSEFPDVEFAELNLVFHRAESRLQELVTLLQVEGQEKESLKQLRELRREYQRYLDGSRDMCESVWAKFDGGPMLLGILTLLTGTMLLIYLVIESRPSKGTKPRMYIGIVGSVWVVIFFFYLYGVGLGLLGLVASISLGFPAIIISTHIVHRVVSSTQEENTNQQTNDQPGISSNTRTDWNFVDLVALACLLLYAGTSFSNSYIVNEDNVSAFLLHTIVYIKLYRSLREMIKMYPSAESSHLGAAMKRGNKIKFDIGRLLTSPGCILFVFVFTFGIFVRLGAVFRACREEQWTCDFSYFLQPIWALEAHMGMYKNVRYFFTIGMLAIIVIVLLKWLRKTGNLNGHSPLVMISYYAMPLALVCTSFHWALHSLPSKLLDALPVWQIVCMPRLVYLIFFMTLICCVFKPLTLFVSSSSIDPPPVSGTGENLVPRLYQHLKQYWNHEATKDPPMVYGLGTVFSAAVLILVTMTALLMGMLLGDGLAPSVTLLLAAMFMLLEIHASYTYVKGKGVWVEDAPWSTVIAWCFLIVNYFFNTGHQHTVTSLGWHAAYTGFHGDHDYYAIPATLITLNTFASHVLGVLALPLIVFWPLTRGVTIFSFESSGVPGPPLDTKGEYVLQEDKDRMYLSTYRLMVTFLLFFSLKLLSTTLATTLHRRHLMVWKIFAPRLVFESATFVLVSALVVVMYAFIIRLSSAVESWVDKLAGYMK